MIIFFLDVVLLLLFGPVLNRFSSLLCNYRVDVKQFIVSALKQSRITTLERVDIRGQSVIHFRTFGSGPINKVLRKFSNPIQNYKISQIGILKAFIHVFSIQS